MKSPAKILFYLVIIAVGAYFGQALIFFPGLWSSQQIRIWQKLPPPPTRVEQFPVTGDDNAVLDGWRLTSTDAQARSYTAAVFHSEAGSLRSNFYLQKWLASMGITSYAVDYRGFGTSSGWPDEQEMYRDASEFVKKVAARENIQPAEVILVGDSVGAAIAAKTAQSIGSKRLLLLSPFTSYPERLGVAGMPYIEKALRFSFETRRPLESLNGSCIFLAGLDRGQAGRFIAALAEAAQGKNSVTKYLSATSASMPELLRQFKTQLEPGLKTCSPSAQP